MKERRRNRNAKDLVLVTLAVCIGMLTLPLAARSDDVVKNNGIRVERTMELAEES